MKKFENLYAGLFKKTLVGGLDLDLLQKQIVTLPQLEIYADNGVSVGFISTDALILAFEGRGKDEPKRKNGVKARGKSFWQTKQKQNEIIERIAGIK